MNLHLRMLLVLPIAFPIALSSFFFPGLKEIIEIIILKMHQRK